MTELIRIAILTVSDRCACGDAVDESGPALARRATESLPATLIAHTCVADEIDAIASALRAWSQPDANVDLILTTGGTGFALRDVTPEAASMVIERPAQGLIHLMLSECAHHTPFACLSRAVAGICDSTLIITLPGSPRGATQSFDALAPVLPHAIAILKGDSTAHPQSN